MAASNAVSAVGGVLTLLEGTFQGTVESYDAQEKSALATFLGVTIDPNDLAASARVDRQILFGFANLGVAHFQAGTPAPVKK
jgi:hypothetical protein